jgi:hypothetical protein
MNRILSVSICGFINHHDAWFQNYLDTCRHLSKAFEQNVRNPYLSMINAIERSSVTEPTTHAMKKIRPPFKESF